jgi:enolase
MSKAAIIENIKARRIFDSRGSEAIEIDVMGSGGSGRSSAPSGASKGRWEVKSYPEGGVTQALRVVKELIAPELIGVSVDDPKTVDVKLHGMDPSPDFSRIGGNTAYAVSLASAIAGAVSRAMQLFEHLSAAGSYSLPYPLGNTIGGGLHAKGDRTDIQEFLVLPTSSKSFAQAAAANIRTHKEVARLIENSGVNLAGRGDEGAWVAPLRTEEALEILTKACRTVSDETGVELRMGADMAASTLWSEKANEYLYQRDNRRLDEGDQIEFVLELIKKFKLAYVEDPLNEESFESFSELTGKVKGTLICGDDLFTTNIKRLERGAKEKSGNAIIIKPNQVGTLSDSFATARFAQQEGYVPVFSHRSGESCGNEIAHLAIALGAPVIKLGVLGGERIAKINELIRIEELLGEKARMANIGI